MGLEKLLDYLKDDIDKFIDRVGYFREEGLDIALDKWDTIKNTDPRILAGVGGGLVLVILVMVLILTSPPSIPIIAKRDVSGILGSNFVVIENEDDQTLQNLTIILDDKYIFRQSQLGPYQELIIKAPEFHYLLGDMQMGDTVSEDLEPRRMTIYCELGEKNIDLVYRKKGFFEKLFGG